MPPIETFYDAASFYGVLAHESHATGHKSRLDRFKKFQDRKAYAFEELIAEISACILGAEMGFRPDFEQSATYIEGWLKALNDDKAMIFRAASEAQKAVDLIKAQAAQQYAQAA
jgi:antirestriction protein ArdC